MAEKITIDVGDAPAKPTAFEALEKIGRLAVKMQEQDAKFQRLAQHLTVPDTSFKVDTDSIYRSIAEYKVDPIIPEGYFERTQEYQQKSLEVLQSINENTANLYSIVELITVLRPPSIWCVSFCASFERDLFPCKCEKRRGASSSSFL